MQTDPKFADYHCGPEWHLAKLKSRFAAILYPFAWRISKKTKRFYCSAEQVAGHFGVSRWTVLRAINELEELGFFSLINKEPFRPSDYTVLSHQDWVKTHPDCCAIRATYPWSGEKGDELGVKLFSLSGGRVKYRPYQLKALRNTELSDEEIAKQFDLFVRVEMHRRDQGGWHGRWASVRFRFLKWLKGELTSDELQRFGLLPFKAGVDAAA
jgi:hypothetical protein